MGLTALDIIVILLVGAGLVVGWLRGFVAEMLSLFAWFLAIVALRYLHAPVRDLLVGPVGTVAGASVLAFVDRLRPRLPRRQARLAPARRPGPQLGGRAGRPACSAPASAR